MPEDRRFTIASTSRLGPDDVARHTFATARRGFEPAEVRSFLEAVARELDAAAARERELLDAVADAQRQARNPVLDETTLTAALGQETAKVLKSAHDAAAELVARAEADVARVRAQVEEELAQARAQAEQHVAERGAQADAAAAELRKRVQDEVTARLDAAKHEAEALLSQARTECRAMLQEAQDLRAKVLADLTRRRRVLHTQIEQLRAGRERLAETISDARSTVDRVTEELFRAEEEARIAAEAAGRQAAAQMDADEVLAREAHGAVAAEPAPAPDVPAEDTSPSDPIDEERRQQAVEELFARLRAERSSAVDEGVTLLVPEPPSASTATPAQASHRAGTVAVAERDDEADHDAAAEPGAVLAPELVRRNDLLGSAASGLARRMKRAMQDDQNDILDRLRAKGAWSPDVLPDAVEHEQRYVRAAVQHLDEAARAGAVFAGASADAAPPVGDIAAELASAIVVPLRRRLNSEGALAEQGDDAALVEHVGSAYREWKGTRVERVTGDLAHGAFAQGVLAATRPGATLRWLVDDEGMECPDCEDNALAGPTPRG
ncbi:MAG: DivIVA domain-containing protein, partial [Acidimicrobiales bacterium]